MGGYNQKRGRAVNEGIADIMGNLCEAYYTKNKLPDWLHDGARNHMNPDGDNAVSYQQVVDGTAPNMEGHALSTILSHAACLMYYGGDTEKPNSAYSINNIELLVLMN